MTDCSKSYGTLSKITMPISTVSSDGRGLKVKCILDLEENYIYHQEKIYVGELYYIVL